MFFFWGGGREGVFLYILDNELYIALSCITEKPRRGVCNKLLTTVINLLLDEVHFSFGFLVT